MDDANDPETRQLINLLNDPRIRYIAHAEPKGASGAYNTGMKNAAGKFINFLDDDDEYLDGILEKQKQAFDDFGDKIGFLWTGITNVEDTESGEKPISTQVWPANFGTRESGLTMSTAIGNGFGLSMRRTCLKKTGYYDETLKVGVDTDFLMQLSKYFGFMTIPEVLVKIHHHGGGQLTDEKHISVRRDCYGKIIDKHFDFLAEHWDAFYVHNKVYVKYCFQTGAYGAGRKALWRLAITFPKRRIAWLDLLSYLIERKEYDSGRLKAWLKKIRKDETEVQLPLRRISGKHRISGKEVSFLYSGHNSFNLNMWGDHLFEEWEEEALKPVHLKELNLKVLNKKYPDCGFLLVEKAMLSGPSKFGIPHIDIPNWIQTWIDTSKPVKQLCSPTKSGINNARRLIAKYGFTFEEADSAEEKKHFYDRMYLPFLRKHTARYLHELPYEDIFTDWFPVKLYHIRIGNESIGGAVANFRNDKAGFGFLGIKEGDARYVKMGAISAMYYFVAQEFHKRNIGKMHLGGSPPFLEHPLTRYKIRMKAQHDSDHKYGDHEITSCFMLDKEKVMDGLFSSLPVVFLKDEEACGLFFPSNKEFSHETELQKALELPERLGIKNNFCLKPPGKKLSVEWQKAL